jgi:hypothetical protein
MDSEFKKVEALLYRYFKDKNKINWYKQKVARLIVRAEYIKLQLEPGNFPHINSDLKAIDYDKVYIQGGSTEPSYIERDMIKQFEKYKEEYLDLKKRIKDLKEIISNLECRNVDLDVLIGTYEGDKATLIDLKYNLKPNEKRSFSEIAEKLNISKSTAVERRDNLILEIIEYMRLLKIPTDFRPNTDHEEEKSII